MAVGGRFACFLLLASVICHALVVAVEIDYDSDDYQEFEDYLDVFIEASEDGNQDPDVETITKVGFETQLLKDKEAHDCVKYGNLLWPAKKCEYEKQWFEEVTQKYGTFDHFDKSLNGNRSCPTKYSRCYFLLNVKTTSRLDAIRKCQGRNARLANVYSKELFVGLEKLIKQSWRGLDVKDLHYWTGGQFNAIRGRKYYEDDDGEFAETNGINWPIWPTNKILKTGFLRDDPRGEHPWMVHDSWDRGPAPWYRNNPSYIGKPGLPRSNKYAHWGAVYIKAVRDDGDDDKLLESGLVNVPFTAPQDSEIPFYSICEYDVNPRIDELSQGVYFGKKN